MKDAEVMKNILKASLEVFGEVAFPQSGDNEFLEFFVQGESICFLMENSVMFFEDRDKATYERLERRFRMEAIKEIASMAEEFSEGLCDLDKFYVTTILEGGFYENVLIKRDRAFRIPTNGNFEKMEHELHIALRKMESI